MRNGLLTNLLSYSNKNLGNSFKTTVGGMSPSLTKSFGKLDGSTTLSPNRLQNLSPQAASLPRNFYLSPQHLSLEIPLKDPLDIEFKLNHKLAKKLYE